MIVIRTKLRAKMLATGATDDRQVFTPIQPAKCISKTTSGIHSPGTGLTTERQGSGPSLVAEDNFGE